MVLQIENELCGKFSEISGQTISETKTSRKKAVIIGFQGVPLDLAGQKTEAVLITNSRKRNTTSIRVGSLIITSKLNREDKF